ncbi:hypothetical protein NBRC10512_007861 [Rhodotorula toruloides]|uniref:RHTO0S04e05270g1_1 n=2 Tax=Rhodotorula toruloides TaxID=5286 RepID=A0A061AQN0_RHOTO|nr:uncharacterized protein RHTO_01985 [Rhodotorula toruloides NP11]EMS21114.1 hypothetical protein RHTO_01985 [Rhodotorula toruloides NP11]CDR39454.1 RHTO0S04e05270g1_1 [Rhodotorula toruloides]
MTALDLSNPALALSFLPTMLSVIQLPPSEPIPTELVAILAGQGEEQAFVSLTRTPAETSVVLPTPLFERLYPSPPPALETSGPWVALQVAGPMDFSLSGILNALTTPLKEAQIPIFAMSTWNTDYVLVDEKHKERTKEVLSEARWKFP